MVDGLNQDLKHILVVQDLKSMYNFDVETQMRELMEVEFKNCIEGKYIHNDTLTIKSSPDGSFAFGLLNT